MFVHLTALRVRLDFVSSYLPRALDFQTDLLVRSKRRRPNLEKCASTHQQNALTPNTIGNTIGEPQRVAQPRGSNHRHSAARARSALREFLEQAPHPARVFRISQTRTQASRTPLQKNHPRRPGDAPRLHLSDRLRRRRRQGPARHRPDPQGHRRLVGEPGRGTRLGVGAQMPTLHRQPARRGSQDLRALHVQGASLFRSFPIDPGGSYRRADSLEGHIRVAIRELRKSIGGVSMFCKPRLEHRLDEGSASPHAGASSAAM